MNTGELKAREIEIVRLMAEGLTNREIGERLFIGVETVRTHAKHIYSKLDVSGREEAADKAHELGLLDDDGSDKLPPVKPNHNLPIQLTSFIGREKQISDITSLLTQHRLVTLTGPGGSGKTRLCLKVAEAILAEFEDGVFFVDLAPISDSEMVVQTIAQALSIIDSGDQPLETLKRAIT